MNRSIQVLLFACLALALAVGCAVDQKQEVQTYRSVLDSGPSARPVEYSSEEPLSLKRAFELVNANNEQLALQGENYLQSLINKDRAVAGYFPTLAFQPSYLRQQRTHIPLASELVPFEATDLPINATFDLNLPKQVEANRSALAAARRQKNLLLDYRMLVFEDAAETYYQILISEKQVEFLKTSVATQEARYNDIRVKEKAGTARSLDVSQVEAQLAATRADLVSAENDARNGRAMLALLLGVPKVDGPLTDQLAIPETLPTEDESFDAACAGRQDLQAALKEVSVAQHNMQAAWSEYFPSIQLNAGYYLHRQSFPADVTWTSIVQINVPIFTAGLIHDDVRTAYSLLRQSSLSLSWMERQILKDVRVDREDLEDSARRLQDLQVQMAAADKALKISDLNRAVGTGTTLERLIAQSQFLRAGLDLNREELTRKIYYLRLLRATGRLDVQAAEAAPAPAPEAAPKTEPEAKPAGETAPGTSPETKPEPKVNPDAVPAG